MHRNIRLIIAAAFFAFTLLYYKIQTNTVRQKGGPAGNVVRRYMNLSSEDMQELRIYQPLNQSQLTEHSAMNKTLNASLGSHIPHQQGFIGGDGRMVLMWTDLTTPKPMWSFNNWSVTHCPYKCQYTNDRSYLNQSSLLLFRLRRLKSPPDARPLRQWVMPYDVKDLPPKKYPNQVWVDVNQESPVYSHSDGELSQVDTIFDYLVTYHSGSDYVYEYRLNVRKKQTPTEPVNYAANKTKMALWYVSNCDALSKREEYTKELQQYNVSVDVFGKCSGLTDGCDGKKDVDCINKVRSQYKFYLAFENSICSEYITEKYWNTLDSANYNIPVALGARLDEYKLLSPPDSFIHVGNFTGAKELAQYLHSVDRDDKKFNSYHSWRETYELYTEKKEPFDCWLCRMAYEQPVGKQSSYSSFWSSSKLCEQKHD